MASLVTAGVLGVLPTTSGADAPAIVGWWYRDVPLSGADEQGSSVEAQATGAPVLFTAAGRRVGPAQVPPPPVLPPVPVPTVPPGVTVPDPGGNVPTPSLAPEGGLLVAKDSTGIRAMAAMRFAASGAGGAIVTLRIAPGSTPSPPIKACPALSDWVAGADQAWSTRPAHDCGRISVSSVLNADQTMMTWALPPHFLRSATSTYDVLLVPYGSDGTPFEVAFEKPGADSFTVTSPFEEELPPLEIPLPEYLPPPADSFSPDGYEFSGTHDPYVSEVVQTAPTGNVRPPARSSGPLNRLVDVLENPTTRRVATALLVALGAYSYWQSNQVEQRAPRLLGALAGPSVAVAGTVARPTATRPRGIGRFSRARTERPPRL